LAAFQANGSFVLNSPRTVAAGTDVKSTSINVLQRSKGTWALAGEPSTCTACRTTHNWRTGKVMCKQTYNVSGAEKQKST
jgi:hypothetical protein